MQNDGATYATIAALETVCTHPLHVLRIRAQSTTTAAPHNGALALTRGLGVRFATVLPMRSAFWFGSRQFDELVPKSLAASFFQSIFDIPTENMVIRRSLMYRSRVFRKPSPLRGLYTGAFPHLCRNTVFAYCVFAAAAEADRSSASSIVAHSSAGACIGVLLSQPLERYKSYLQIKQFTVPTPPSLSNMGHGLGYRISTAAIAMSIGQLSLQYLV